MRKAIDALEPKSSMLWLQPQFGMDPRSMMMSRLRSRSCPVAKPDLVRLAVFYLHLHSSGIRCIRDPIVRNFDWTRYLEPGW